jgi:hypothetical protein
MEGAGRDAMKGTGGVSVDHQSWCNVEDHEARAAQEAATYPDSPGCTRCCGHHCTVTLDRSGITITGNLADTPAGVTARIEASRDGRVIPASVTLPLADVVQACAWAQVLLDQAGLSPEPAAI